MFRCMCCITIWGGDTANRTRQAAKDAANQAKQIAQDAANKVASGTTDLVNKVGDYLRGEADNVVQFYQSAVKTASPLVNEAIAEVAKNLPSEADAKAFGKMLASELIHRGIPQATAMICSALCEALLPEATPMSGQLGSQLGKMLGEQIANKVGDETGYGLRRRRPHKVLLRGGTLLHGVPYPHMTKKTEDRINTHGLTYTHHKGKNGLYKGGSFTTLG